MFVVNVTWRRIRARNNLELLISSESDLDEFVLVAAVSPSDANDEGLESLVVVAVAAVSPSDDNDEGLESLVVSRSS